MSYENFTTYAEEDPNSRITKTASKVTWTALTTGEKAWVVKNMGGDYFDGDFRHQFECEYSNEEWPAICIFWEIANGAGDRNNSGSLQWFISFARESNSLMLKAHKWGDGPTDLDKWEDAEPSTRYYITIQHDWDGGAQGTGRTTAYIRTGSHEGALQATLQVDRGTGAQHPMSHIYGCQTQDDEDEGYISGFTENLDLSPPLYKTLAGTSSITSTTAGEIEKKTAKYLAGVATVSSTTSGAISRDRELAGTTAIASTTSSIMRRSKSVSRTTTLSSTTSGELSKIVVKMLAGISVISSTATGEIKLICKLIGTTSVISTVVGNLASPERLLAGTVAIESTTAGELVSPVRALAGVVVIASTTAGTLEITKELLGVVAITSTTGGILRASREIAGTSVIATTTAGELTVTGPKELAGVSEISSTTSGALEVTRELIGVVAISSTVIGELTKTAVRELEGVSAISSTTAGELTVTGAKELAGTTAIKSTVTGILIIPYVTMPPEMHAALIDPYSGGAWLWLVEINIPGYNVIRLARNPVNIVYGGTTYEKNNFDIGLAALSGDGSIPRIMLRVAQDEDYTLEDKINATKGAGGGTVKIIRTHEDFLSDIIEKLEQSVNILTANSDTTHVVFSLGMPNPLLKKIPLRRYSSKKCPYSWPGLFKGPECQLALEHADTTCTGTYEDCYTKGNAVHWGGDLGLDPNVAKV